MKPLIKKLILWINPVKKQVLTIWYGFFEWCTGQEVAWRYWRVSVDVTNKPVSNQLYSLIFSTTKKDPFCGVFSRKLDGSMIASD